MAIKENDATTASNLERQSEANGVHSLKCMVKSHGFEQEGGSGTVVCTSANAHLTRLKPQQVCTRCSANVIRRSG